ncbi:hypothetical protein HYC85_015125 [Camellia sinensis]|uniref:Uncharacterized protein n=1 Tax=Camellia sinensis TaxID=4442 RepID=A0A7J7HBG3_CAMSI|nr:hypothetical protein HYC85_015125 [Camellia sinensis]
MCAVRVGRSSSTKDQMRPNKSSPWSSVELILRPNRQGQIGRAVLKKGHGIALSIARWVLKEHCKLLNGEEWENREGSKGRLVRRRRDFDLERCFLLGGETSSATVMIDGSKGKGMLVSTWLLILLFKFLWPPPNPPPHLHARVLRHLLSLLHHPTPQFPQTLVSLSLSLSPLPFFLLTIPFQAQLIHSHDYEAFQFRSSTQSFEAKTLDVVNIGPAFRSHYSDFLPNCLFSALGCELRGLNSMVEDGKGEIESLEGMSRVSNEQRELDLCAEEFDVGQLNRLLGLIIFWDS